MYLSIGMLHFNKKMYFKDSIGIETERGMLSCFSLVSFLLLLDFALSSNLLPCFPLNQVGNLFHQEGFEVWFAVTGDVEIEKYLLAFVRKALLAGFHLYWLVVLIIVTLQDCQ